MGQGGAFWDRLEGVFGKGNLTSGYRSQEEQDALVARGATKATTSTHTTGGGYDVRIGAGRSEEHIREQAGKAGLQVKYIRRESGRGKNQGTGAHWHIEVEDSKDKTWYGSAKGTQGKGTPQVAGKSGGAPARDVLAEVDAAVLPPESRAASQNVTSNSQAIFNSDKKLGAQFRDVDAALGEQGEAIDVLSAVTQVAQQTQMGSMIRQVEDTRAISNEITQGTQELKRQVMPIFEARGRVADQLDKLVTMNPLERGIRGIFDLNYDKEYLEGQLDDFDRTLKARGDDFKYLNDLQSVALGEIDRRYKLDNALGTLTVDQAKEDLGLVGLRVQQTAALLGSTRDEIASQAQLITAKATARGDLMGRLDQPTLLNLMNKATESGGMVAFNGVEFSAHELRQQFQKNDDMETSVRMHKMALESGQMDLADKAADQIARNMTRTDVEAAIANGGMYKGIQIPQDTLTQMLQTHMRQGELQAQQIANEMPASMALQAGSDALNAMTGLYYRSSGLYGKQDFDSARGYMQQNTANVRALIEATKNGAAPEVIAALTQKVAQTTQTFQKSISSTILRSTGGDKTSAQFVESFVYGTPLDPGVAAEGLAHFAIKGSMPQGVALSPESKQIFQRAQKAVEKFRTNENGTPRSAAQLKSLVLQEIQSDANNIAGAAQFEQIQKKLPALAKELGHPLGAISNTQWRGILANAADSADQMLSGKLNTTPEIVRTMRTTFKPIDATPASGKLYEAFMSPDSQAAYNGHEQTTMIQAINQLKPIKPGVENSEILREFLEDPKLYQRIDQELRTNRSNSFGDYLLGPIVEGAAARNVASYGNMVTAAESSVFADQRAAGDNLRKGYANSSTARLNIVLATIPGVGKAGAAALQPFLKQTLAGDEAGQVAATAFDRVVPGDRQWNRAAFGKVQEERFLNALRSTKFDDPSLEAYRKKAVAGFDESAQRSDTYIGHVVDAISGAR